MIHFQSKSQGSKAMATWHCHCNPPQGQTLPSPAPLTSSWSKGKAADGASQRQLHGVSERCDGGKPGKGRWSMAVPQQCCCHPCHFHATPIGNCPCHGLPSLPVTQCLQHHRVSAVLLGTFVFLKQCWCLKPQPLKAVVKFIVYTQASL